VNECTHVISPCHGRGLRAHLLYALPRVGARATRVAAGTGVAAGGGVAGGVAWVGAAGVTARVAEG
jgi:hypothetical protein